VDGTATVLTEVFRSFPHNLQENCGSSLPAGKLWAGIVHSDRTVSIHNISSLLRLRALLATFDADLFFEPEEGGDMFLRNISRLSADYTVLYPR
jgi:hypothetical protein